MATQEEFLDRLWKEVINSNMNGAWIASKIAHDRTRPDNPFGEVGSVLQRMLDKGVPKEEICRLAREVAYEACFSTLCMMEDPGLDEGEFSGIHETLLQADPSGKEAGPGSWPFEPGRPMSKASPAIAGPTLILPRSFTITFSPDSSLVAVPATGVVLDLASGNQLSKCRWPSNTTDIVFFPSCDRIAGVNTTGVVAICDIATGHQLQKHRMKSEGDALAVSPDGHTVLAGNWAGDIFAWDAEAGDEVAHRQFADTMIRDVRFSKDSKTIFVAGHIKDYTGHPELFVSVLDAKLGQELSRTSVSRTLDHMSLGPDLGTAVGFGSRCALMLYSLVHGKIILESEVTHVKQACISPDGKLVAAVCDDLFVFLEAETLKVIAQLQRIYANHVSFSPDGRFVGLATWKTGEVWETPALLTQMERG